MAGIAKSMQSIQSGNANIREKHSLVWFFRAILQALFLGLV